MTYHSTSFYVPTETTISATISTAHLLGHFPQRLPSKFDPAPFNTPLKWYSDVTGHPHLHLFKELYVALGLLAVKPSSDYIIIGGGIAGLYAAWRLSKDSHDTIAILEKEASLGGRIKEVMFAGVPVKTGAGVGRLHKDIRLIELMQYFNIPINTFKSRPTYTFTPISLKHTLKTLRKAVQKQPELQMLTFAAVATRILGANTYELFQSTTGFTDYENANVMDALEHYGFDDLFKSQEFFTVPWTQLTECLIADILKANPHNRIITNVKVTGFDTEYQTIHSQTLSAPHTYKKHLLLALPFTPLKRLLSPQQFQPIQSVVAPQPFLRIYAKLHHQVSPGNLITPLPLRKITSITQNITMVAYCDNDDAVALKDTNTDQLQRLWVSATGSPVRFEKVLRIYWPEGTHYSKTLTTPELLYNLQRSIHPQVTIIGEILSTNQGWVHGALESVDRILQV